MHQAVGENSSKGLGNRANDIEDSIALLKIEADVPGRHEVDGAREETRFKDTEEDTETTDFFPFLGEPESNHNPSPYHTDCGDEEGWANLAHGHNCRRLTDDVRDEEDQRDDAVAVVLVKLEVYVHSATILA